MGLEKINEYRKKVGISVEELSLKSGVPIGTLSKITAGITKDPKLETIRSIAYALGITLDDLEDNPKYFSPTIQETTLLSAFRMLNGTGQEEAVKRVEELTCIDKYKKQSKITDLPKKAEAPEHLQTVAAHLDGELTDEVKDFIDKF